VPPPPLVPLPVGNRASPRDVEATKIKAAAISVLSI